MPKLTNEEYAILIQKGHTEYYNELWENVKDIVRLHSYRFYIQYKDICQKNGVTPEDLNQAGFIAITEAVDDFKPEKEFKFVTYINFHALNSFKSTIGLLKRTKDAFQDSQSLDDTIGDDETTFAEAIPDPIDYCAASEEKIFNDELSTVLKECINDLNEKQKIVINNRYFNEYKQKELVHAVKVTETRINQIEHEALKKLRTGKNLTRLKPFADEIFSRAISGTGLTNFKNNQASSVELTVDYLERMKRK